MFVCRFVDSLLFYFRNFPVLLWVSDINKSLVAKYWWSVYVVNRDIVWHNAICYIQSHWGFLKWIRKKRTIIYHMYVPLPPVWQINDICSFTCFLVLTPRCLLLFNISPLTDHLYRCDPQTFIIIRVAARAPKVLISH